jgi:hypothetical protein
MGGVGKKMGPLRSTQGKIENILYECALVAAGKGRVAGVAQTARPAADDA